MKKVTLTLCATVILMTSCQKEEITPSKTDLKPKSIDCKRCDGDWDITDSIPANQ